MNQTSSQSAAANEDRVGRGFTILMDYYRSGWRSQYPTYAITLILSLAYVVYMDLVLHRPHSSVSYECVAVVFLLLLVLPLLIRAIQEIRGGYIIHGAYNVRISATGETFIRNGDVRPFIIRETNSTEDFKKDYALVLVKDFISDSLTEPKRGSVI
jgi:hypothetical protein